MTFQINSRTCLVGKRVYKYKKKRRSTVRHTGTKNASRPANEPLINRLSTAVFVPSSVYTGFRLYMLLERRLGDAYSMPWRERWAPVSEANNFVGTQSCPTPLGRSAWRFEPTRLWYVRVLYSKGLIGAWLKWLTCFHKWLKWLIVSVTWFDKLLYFYAFRLVARTSAVYQFSMLLIVVWRLHDRSIKV